MDDKYQFSLAWANTYVNIINNVSRECLFVTNICGPTSINLHEVGNPPESNSQTETNESLGYIA